MSAGQEALDRLDGALASLAADGQGVLVDLDGVRGEIARIFGLPEGQEETADLILAALSHAAVEYAPRTVLTPAALSMLQGLRVGERLGYARGMAQLGASDG